MDHEEGARLIPRDPRFAIKKWHRWGCRRLYLHVGAEDVAYLDEVSGIVHCWNAEHLHDVRKQWPNLSVKLVAPPKRLKPDIPAQRTRTTCVSRPGARLMVVAHRMLEARDPDAAIPWLIGALGEQLVGTSLTKVLHPMGWSVLHSLQPFGGSGADIDHLVIGVCGVWCVNTKTHPRSELSISATTITRDSKKTSYLDEVRLEAEAVKRWLDSACGFDVPVFPALALVAPVVHAESDPPADVMVWHTDFGAGLVMRPPLLTRSQVEVVQETAAKQMASAAA